MNLKCSTICNFFSMLFFIGELLVFIYFDSEKIVNYICFYCAEAICVSKIIVNIANIVISIKDTTKINLLTFLKVYCFAISFLSIFLSYEAIVFNSSFSIFIVPFIGMVSVFFSIISHHLEQSSQNTEEDKLINDNNTPNVYQGTTGYTNNSNEDKLFPSVEDVMNQKPSEIHNNETENENVNKPGECYNIPPPADDN